MEHSFENGLNWNEVSKGKLWNYHLKYAEFLLDCDLDVSVKLQWLADLSEKIQSGELPPEAFPCSMRMIYTCLFISHHKQYRPDIINAVCLQNQWLKDNVEYHIDANHLLINRIALSFFKLMLGIEDDDEVHRELVCELNRQITIDGMHYERSTMYHLEILGLLLCLYGCIREPSSYLFVQITPIVSKMYSWMCTMMDDSNYIPPFQDSTRASLEKIKEIKWACDQLGIAVDRIQLGQCGYRKFNFSSNTIWVNAGNISPSYQAGHAHADQMHFEWRQDGKMLLVDTGVSTYELQDRRLEEKSSHFHNTVVSNHDNQSDIWSFFRLGKRAKLTLIQDDEMVLKAVINAVHFTHIRSFIFSADGFEILDQLDADKRGTAYFHFDYTLKEKLTQTGPQSFKLNECTIEFKGPLFVKLVPYFQALDFNKLISSVRLEVVFIGELRTQIIWNEEAVTLS
ncbi:MAG: heparinase II/III-family protein [Saprospiraceae bacterium]|nr:heparinase II/III-family protein [Saprospiraceae bacterium]